jgi:hypothetical protein
MRPGIKGLTQPKTVEHFPLRYVSASRENARDRDPGHRRFLIDPETI